MRVGVPPRASLARSLLRCTVVRAAGCMRASRSAGCERVARARAARRRTHKNVSADSPSKASSGIAVISLLRRYLRARDEATRQLVGLKKPRRGAARRGRARASERAGHHKQPCMRQPCIRVGVVPPRASLARSLANALLRCCMRAREWCAPPDWRRAREKMRRMLARHGVDSRRRTHNVLSADSPSKASSGIAVILLPLRDLRARD